MAKRQTRVGGDALGSAPSRGRDRRGENDTDRSRVDRGIPRSVGGRCRRRNGRRTSPPRDGRSPPTIDGAAPPAEKRPRAGVPPSPRARPSDRALESILAGSRVHRRRRGVPERRSRVARVPGPSRSRPVPPASDGTAWPERKSACAITLGGRETAAARNARVERARTEVGQVVSHNKDERSGRAVRLMRAGEARASIVRRARVIVENKRPRWRTTAFVPTVLKASRDVLRDACFDEHKNRCTAQRLTWLRILSSLSNAISLSARPEAL